MENHKKASLIRAVERQTNWLDGKFVADNIALLGLRENEERLSAKLRGVEYIGTDYAFLASLVAYEMESEISPNWQYSTAEVISFIEAQ
jgi:hypothetical protein